MSKENDEFLQLLKQWEIDLRAIGLHPYEKVVLTQKIPDEFFRRLRVNRKIHKEQLAVTITEYTLLTKFQNQFFAWLRLQQ